METTPAALGCWLRDYKEQVFLFTRDLPATYPRLRCGLDQ